jgi:hypothetical protein
LRSGDDDARRIIEWSKRTGRQVTVRLVKGAYWDYETINAEQQGWPVPVWSRKVDTDASFERMAAAFVASTPATKGEGGVKLALGSHNARSIAATLAALEKRGLPKSALELQMLYGMGDQLKSAAIDLDLRLREYCPVGELIPGMAYLVRRLLENSSNESWLKAGFKDNASAEKLLASPHRAFDTDPGATSRNHRRARVSPQRSRAPTSQTLRIPAPPTMRSARLPLRTPRSPRGQRVHTQHVLPCLSRLQPKCARVAMNSRRSS